MKNTSQRKKLKIEITIVIIISLITGIMAYLNQYYHAEGVEDALESDVEVTVTKTEDGYFFDGKGYGECHGLLSGSQGGGNLLRTAHEAVGGKWLGLLSGHYAW